MRRSAAEIVREYGPFTGVDGVHGVTCDGQRVWIAAGDQLQAFDPASGETQRSLDVAAHAGTAFDGEHLFQIAGDRIQKIDPESGRVLATIPAPGGGNGDSELAWAEGSLWVGQYGDRKIHQVDSQTGAILRTIESNRFVTGVTWIDGELWHGTWEDDESELRRVDPRTGEVLESLEMPAEVRATAAAVSAGPLQVGLLGARRAGVVDAESNLHRAHPEPHAVSSPERRRDSTRNRRDLDRGARPLRLGRRRLGVGCVLEERSEIDIFGADGYVERRFQKIVGPRLGAGYAEQSADNPMQEGEVFRGNLTLVLYPLARTRLGGDTPDTRGYGAGGAAALD